MRQKSVPKSADKQKNVPDSADEIEARAVELARKGQFKEARNLFRQVVPLRKEPFHRAKALVNVMLTYEKEGDKDKAIAICRQILALPGLQNTLQGTHFHGQMTSYLARLEGRPTLRDKLGCSRIILFVFVIGLLIRAFIVSL